MLSLLHPSPSGLSVLDKTMSSTRRLRECSILNMTVHLSNCNWTCHCDFAHWWQHQSCSVVIRLGAMFEPWFLNVQCWHSLEIMLFLQVVIPLGAMSWPTRMYTRSVQKERERKQKRRAEPWGKHKSKIILHHMWAYMFVSPKCHLDHRMISLCSMLQWLKLSCAGNEKQIFLWTKKTKQHILRRPEYMQWCGKLLDPGGLTNKTYCFGQSHFMSQFSRTVELVWRSQVSFAGQVCSCCQSSRVWGFVFVYLLQVLAFCESAKFRRLSLSLNQLVIFETQRSLGHESICDTTLVIFAEASIFCASFSF